MVRIEVYFPTLVESVIYVRFTGNVADILNLFLIYFQFHQFLYHLHGLNVKCSPKQHHPSKLESSHTSLGTASFKL